MPSNSSSSSSNSWWQFFWKLKIPLKVRILVWKACHDWIPTKVNIARRGIRTSNICDGCKIGNETTLHALWNCKRLRDIRGEWNDKKGTLTGNFSNLLEMLQIGIANKSLGEVELFCVVIWRIWFGRNSIKHSQLDFIWKDVINWSEVFLSDFHRATSSLQYMPSLNGNKLTCKWTPPSEGMYKVNCDTAVDRINSKVGFGIVIRNSKGEVMASCAQSMVANFSVKTAKLFAVWKSIIFSGDCGLTPCSFELDEACIVKWIKNGCHRDSANGIILNDIDLMVANLGEVAFCHTDKSANRVARGLAIFALKSSDDTFWMEYFPCCDNEMLQADMPG
ncbi:hypothetical protein Dsin_029226 [Dipteronia sinensis]|uniref:Reverse transcriptase zinc-binding domain-containing protein n=1 Tax=Dipteronia sinensis TaxID=43782 RepID=A0AAD9ZSP8_9ROSI|nr:hypothetical protein Dsin_029226 [Dipteronia sinensis]